MSILTKNSTPEQKILTVIGFLSEYRKPEVELIETCNEILATYIMAKNNNAFNAMVASAKEISKIYIAYLDEVKPES